MGMITIDEKKKKKFAYHRICVFYSSKTNVWSLDFDKLSSTYNSEYLIICPCSTSLRATRSINVNVIIVIF